MSDLTWYSREGADQRFLTRSEAAGLASKAENSQSYATLGSRIDSVQATAEAALPAVAAASTYATKAEVEAVRQRAEQVQPAPTPQAPDLSGYATRAEMQAADVALGQRIDSVSGVATAAATKSELADYAAKADLASYATTAAVEGTYATKESLSGYLKSADASDTYATKAQLAQAQLGGAQNAPDLSGLATKAEVRQAGEGLGSRIDQVKAIADAALPASTASSTYATKEALEAVRGSIPPVPDTSGFITSEAADGKYAAKGELSQYVTSADADGKYAAKSDLSGYVTSADARATYSAKAEITSVEDSVRQAREVADAALPKSEAASTYATKDEVEQVKAGSKVDLSGYLTKDAANSTFVQQDSLARELSQYATLDQANKLSLRVDDLGKLITPFKAGDRYYSPVTYFWPDYYNDGQPGKSSKWAQILKFAGELGIVVLNRNSGNWDTFDSDFQKQAELALGAGAKRAVFYVKTQYLAATLPASDRGRNGVPDVDKYTPDYILSQLDKAKTQYGDVCQGVFLDETINGWGDQAGRVPAYKDLIDRIRQKYGKDFLIVVNAGSNISPDMCKLDFDVCMMFEGDASRWLADDKNSPILPDHMKAYPSTRWWAVVHGVNKDNYLKVFEKADALSISHLYITDGVLVEDKDRGGQWEPVGNPYQNPPSSQLTKLASSWIKGTLGLSLEVEALKAALANMGAGKGGFLVLGPNDPVPANTPDDTVIVRREA